MAARADISSSSLCIEVNPLQKLEDSLRVSLDKLKVFEASCSTVGGNTKVNSRASYWNTLGACIQAVSKECTKVSVAFSKPPLPSKQATKALVDAFEVVVTAVLATFRAFNGENGILLHSALKTYVIDLNKALLDFVKSINCQKKDEMLRTVGIVWECCENFASLPKDMKELALKETKSCFGLVNDAITESEEYYQGWRERHCELLLDEEDNTTGRLQEQHILASIGLAKVAKSLLKRITKCLNKNAQIDDVSKVKELENITQTIKLLSPSVDDLLCSIYTESLTECHSEGLKLASLVEKLIQYCRSSHFCLDEDDSWLDFISQALDHNLKKLTAMEQST